MGASFAQLVDAILQSTSWRMLKALPKVQLHVGGAVDHIADSRMCNPVP